MTTILITRPEPENRRTADKMAAIGIRPLLMPFLSFHSLAVDLPLPNEFAALALTSTNTLRALKEQNYLEIFLHLPVFAVGEKTAEAARSAGFSSVITAESSLASLVECIKTARPPGTIFYPAARHRAGDLAGVLRGEGIEVGTFAIYRMQAKSSLSAAEKKLLNSGKIEAAAFYSARTTAAFANICRKHQLQLSDRLSVLCLSENIAMPLHQAGFSKPLIAEAPNEQAMLALALSFSSVARK